MTAGEKNGSDRLPNLLLIALHLGPGIVTAAVFFLLSGMLVHRGFNSYLVLMLTVAICLAPLELGLALLWSVKSTGAASLRHAVSYLRKGTAIDYTVLPLVLFFCCSVLAIPAAPSTLFLQHHLPDWFPVWATTEGMVKGLAGAHGAQRSITFVLAVLVSGLVAPIVEEMYYRGFLLSRTERWGAVAPLANSLMFGIYHIWTPWNVAAIFLKFLPLAYVASFKKDVRIGIVVHCLFNLFNVFWLFSGLPVTA